MQNKAARFIQDYSTNTAQSPRNAFVNLQGKIIAVVDQHKINEEELWLVVERAAAPRLMTHLDKYLFLTGTTIALDKKKKVYWDLENKIKPAAGDLLIPQKTGQLLVTEAELETNVSEEEFTFFRLKNNLPFQEADYGQEMVLNLADDTLISFTKGCYLGQEIVARVHYRAKPPKKLVVKMFRDCTAEEQKCLTSRATDPDTGEIYGFIFETSSAQ